MVGISLIGALATGPGAGESRRNRLTRPRAVLAAAGALAVLGALWVAAYMAWALFGPVLAAALAGFGPSGVLGTLALSPLAVRAYRQERACRRAAELHYRSVGHRRRSARRCRPVHGRVQPHRVDAHH
ncbi:hypothetical protein [Nocardia paucivorans]|uniref:hypothetical protein n=1 Tax=Nocardia paucivorans TaxID=114259 RepID=UPI000307F791|nr:hypothetical protein [Nocardia paucivorans]